jgi:glutamate racemase
LNCHVCATDCGNLGLSIVSSAPVGIFDSGVGGLSVLRDIRAALPAESIDYVADSANAPWGDKPAEFVRRRGLEIAGFLVGQGVKAIVIGSNTGTAGSAEALRATLTMPVVAIEPGIKPAAAATKSGVVGAIVTTTMGASDRMASLLDRFGRNVRVISVPVPGLVEHVEAADLDSAELRRLVESYLRPLLDQGADTIVLGSTHYVFLRPLIAEIAGEDVTIVDTGTAVARQLARVLDERDLAAPHDAKASERFWTSGDPVESERVMSALLGRKVSVQELTV